VAEQPFDRVARDYEAIHERSLPPGVHSEEFVRQKAETLAPLFAPAAGAVFDYLDFGCGNGRLFAALARRPGPRALLAAGRLRLCGYDPSAESIAAAREIVGPLPVALASRLEDLPPGAAFDLVVSCNVFHHIAPAARPAAAATLCGLLKPGGRVLLWEHNPLNPFTRLVVAACPFDRGVSLLSLPSACRLFSPRGFRPAARAYVNVVPPGWLKLPGAARLERGLARFPVGAQYWVLFARDA